MPQDLACWQMGRGTILTSPWLEIPSVKHDFFGTYDTRGRKSGFKCLWPKASLRSPPLPHSHEVVPQVSLTHWIYSPVESIREQQRQEALTNQKLQAGQCSGKGVGFRVLCLPTSNQSPWSTIIAITCWTPGTFPSALYVLTQSSMNLALLLFPFGE